ncbi:MAG: sulfatase [Proteobacteria bacterium]|nr:sulfatase [Pseudomonadota bacterium]
MKDALRSGVFAGQLAGLLIGLIETCFALSAVQSSGAPFYGLLLAPFFYWALLLPAGTLGGAAIGFSHRCWHSRDTLMVREWAIAEITQFRKGSLVILGWFWGTLLVLGSVCATGTLLHLYFEEIFRNQMLIGLVLTFAICIAELVLIGLVRHGIYLTGAMIVKLRTRGLDMWLSSGRLAIASGMIMIAGISVCAYALSTILTDIGIAPLLWLFAVPLIVLTAFATATATAQRWQSMAHINAWLIALPLGGLVAVLGLGEIEAVRQAAFVSDTPATKLATLYRALSDVDGDGASNFFGGLDCAPFDPAIGPFAREIPNNGIDDNCMAGDATWAEQNSDHELKNVKAYCEPPKGFPKRPNLVLITVDALRADHMPLYGYKRKTTPGIERHAKRGVVFERSYSQGTGTISSMPSVFTGKYPYQLKYTDDRMPPTISHKEITLAEHLKTAGYETLGVTQIYYSLKGRWNLLQGFDHVDMTLAHRKPIADRRISSPQTAEIALDLIERGQRSKKPYFLWVHFYDIHVSYLDHPEQKSFGDKRIDKYDNEILFTDRYVTKVLDVLLGPNQPPTVVVLAADHGDGFRSDRGRSNHAYGLFNELIHVPLIVWAPGAKPRRVDTPVGNIDITPTLINAAKLNRPYVRGHSLFPYLYEGYRDPDRLIFSAKTFGRGKRKRYRKSVTGMHWKMIRWITEKKEFLFNLDKDPKEKRNVVSRRRHRKTAAKLRRQIDLFLERNAIDTTDMEQKVE